MARAEPSVRSPAKRIRRRARLALQVATRSRGVPPLARFLQWAEAALSRPAQFTLRIVGEREAKKINRQFRGKARSTNVITFRYHEDGRSLSGDIVLCAPVIAREARRRRQPREAHYAHLTVHGLLHMQGFDHRNAGDARVMERLETRILRRLGYPDPYTTHGR
ncbi:MAG: rRNA maturation RNase YbeY [Betaproteobacteria bacterium RIFCSPLOWO2_02_FULL_64_12]|nr:MAG: rRNA maturation RNase YbeY [Betaproteobacteria bacterium RIFCSPLOWO2_02_FULL_64_12]